MGDHLSVDRQWVASQFLFRPLTGAIAGREERGRRRESVHGENLDGLFPGEIFSLTVLRAKWITPLELAVEI